MTLRNGNSYSNPCLQNKTKGQKQHEYNNNNNNKGVMT